MNSRRRQGRRVRVRLVATVVGVVTAAAVALSLLAHLLVARSLRSEVLDRAVEDARFNVEVLAEERLVDPVQPGDIVSSGLAGDFQRRDVEVYVDFDEGEDFVSGLDVLVTPEAVSPAMLDLVASGRIAAEWVEADEQPLLVVGARRPPEGPDFYFFTAVDHVERALSQLRLVLLGASAVLVLAGVVAGWRVARLAGSLSDTVDELTAARERERRFVADVSHELRTPVAALVHEAAELAAGMEAMDPGMRRVVELLGGDVRRLRTLVEELLELSRLDAGAAPDVLLEAIDIPKFLGAVAAQRLPEATVRAPAGLRAWSDRRRLERIVGNLLDNARVHANSRSVTIDAELEGSTLSVSVGDRGVGIPDYELERIFDRFAKSDRARSGSGSGLGLAIAREHAHALGGDVIAWNRDGGGLAVEVRLPAGNVADL